MGEDTRFKPNDRVCLAYRPDVRLGTVAATASHDQKEAQLVFVVWDNQVWNFKRPTDAWLYSDQLRLAK